TLYNFNGTGSSVSNEIDATNTGVTGKTTSYVNGGSLGLTSTPVNSVPLLLASGGVDPVTNPFDPSSESPPDTSAQTVYVDPAVLLMAYSLGTIVEQAIENWEATALTAAQDAYLRSVTVSFADLGGITLGQATPGQITIDDNAAGLGWYIDLSPQDNAEFPNAISATELLTGPSLAPAGHIEFV